jgi:hypothetical protein
MAAVAGGLFDHVRQCVPQREIHPATASGLIERVSVDGRAGAFALFGVGACSSEVVLGVAATMHRTAGVGPRNGPRANIGCNV